MINVKMKNLIFGVLLFLPFLPGCQEKLEKENIGAAMTDSYYTEPHRPQFHERRAPDAKELAAIG
ncbi:MAG: hypothetical protein KDD09_20195, partial [Phaeodactylibacter sp.]|nr:hypothetical protein [Phaeodactylibacter sp.]